MRARKVEKFYMDPRTEKMLAERAERVAATPAPLRGPLNSVQTARRWAKTHAHAAKLLAGAGVAVFVVAYYLIVTLPAQRADQLQVEAHTAETIKATTLSRQTSVSACLSKAQTDADAQWTAACKARKQGPNCPLPEQQAEAFERAEKIARNACLLKQ